MPVFLKVLKVEENADNGIRAFHVRIIEENAEQTLVSQGPIKIVSIDHTSLESNHNGSYENFLMMHKERMAANFEGQKKHRTEAESFVGKML